MRILIIVSLVFLSWTTFAKERLFFGRIVDVAGGGISNAYLATKDYSEQFFTNANGQFSFKFDENATPQFIVGAQGYNTKVFDVDILPEDSIIIELEERKNILSGTDFKIKGQQPELEASGIYKGRNDASCYLSMYDEIAVYLPLTTDKICMLKEIGAYITHAGYANCLFRLHLYAYDSSTGAPGKEITDTSIYMSGNKGREWVIKDMKEYFIQLKGGVYLSMEWLVAKNNLFPKAIPEGHKSYYSGLDSLKRVYNGQVLGLAWTDIRPKVYRRYAFDYYSHSKPGEWKLTDPLVGGYKRNGWLTPMLYVKYTYMDTKDKEHHN